jgi:hypothetical protein
MLRALVEGSAPTLVSGAPLANGVDRRAGDQDVDRPENGCGRV